MTNEEIKKALSMPYITRGTIVSILNTCGVSRDVADKLLRNCERIARGKYITDDVIEKLKLSEYVKRLNQVSPST